MTAARVSVAFYTRAGALEETAPSVPSRARAYDLVVLTLTDAANQSHSDPLARAEVREGERLLGTFDRLFLRQLRQARSSVQTTPAWWDRDCRVCLELDGDAERAYYARTGRQGYTTHGGDRVLTWGASSEEVHADHSDGELAAYAAALGRRAARTA